MKKHNLMLPPLTLLKGDGANKITVGNDAIFTSTENNTLVLGNGNVSVMGRGLVGRIKCEAANDVEARVAA